MSTELTQERVRTLFDYDSESGILLRKFKSGKLKPCGHKPTHSVGYGQVNIGEKMHLTHRIIWLWYYGSWPQNEIDHIDRDRMNNRIGNLKSVTRAENNHNKGLSSNNSSGFPGVGWSKRDKKYYAQIWINSKKIHLGYFTAPEEAYLAYQLAKIEHHPTSPIAKQYLRELTLVG